MLGRIIQVCGVAEIGVGLWWLGGPFFLPFLRSDFDVFSPLWQPVDPLDVLMRVIVVTAVVAPGVMLLNLGGRLGAR